MQRRETKQSRAANSKERDFIVWMKSQDCSYCGNPGPSRFDHCAGSSAKVKVGFETIHIGHYFGLSECLACAAMTHKAKRLAFGPHHIIWSNMTSEYSGIPDCVRQGIKSYGEKYGR